jgi:hypothetical protein
MNHIIQFFINAYYEIKTEDTSQQNIKCHLIREQNFSLVSHQISFNKDDHSNVSDCRASQWKKT